MCLFQRNSLGKNQMDLNPMRVADVPVTALVKGETLPDGLVTAIDILARVPHAEPAQIKAQRLIRWVRYYGQIGNPG